VEYDATELQLTATRLRRRRDVLLEQAARTGANTNPDIVTELEDIDAILAVIPKVIAYRQVIIGGIEVNLCRAHLADIKSTLFNRANMYRHLLDTESAIDRGADHANIR